VRQHISGILQKDQNYEIPAFELTRGIANLVGFFAN
jgi:hypothetical protein